MPSLSPESETRLRAAIAEYKLHAVGTEIVDATVKCASLDITTPEDYACVGNSRYGGVPDLPVGGALWPKIDSTRFYNFYLQVNLADLPDFVGNVLPRTGMLYCFMADYDDAVIVYADVEPNTLVKMDAKSQDAFSGWDDGALNPHKIEVQTAIDVPSWYSEPYANIQGVLYDVTEEEEAEEALERLDGMARALYGSGSSNAGVGQLFGQPAYIGQVPDKEKGGDASDWHDTLLLVLYTASEVNAMFGDAGYVQFFMRRYALTVRDFSSVSARLESS